MKQYKLIKKYPGSPEIGTIAEADKIDHVYYYYSGNSYSGIGANDIENYSEFWEEVVEKDCEILSITNSYNNIYKLGDDGMYHYNYYKDQNLTVDICLVTKYGSGFKIHSVKRLSDGEIFTVGDNTTTGIIKEFIFRGDCIGMATGEHTSWVGIKVWRKGKQFLFKTADGVDIYEDDKFYCINANLQEEIQKIFATRKTVKSCFYRYFSTKEKAEEYIIMNKPCLSIKDCLGLTSWFNMEEDLKELVRTKIGKL